MRSFLLITVLFVLSPLLLFSQQKINQFDGQGNRNGAWKKYYSGTDQLRYEGTFLNGKEVGVFKFYCENCKDQPTAIKEFNAKDNTAIVKYFTIKGKLVSEGKMDGKSRIGEWVYYHEKSNNIMSRENYVNGKLHGKKITYYSNNNITEVLNYNNGMMDGENSYFSPEGILLKKLNYSKDKLEGHAYYYDASGMVIIEGNYKNDKKYGIWRYFKDGKLVLEEIYPKPKDNEK